MIIIDVDSDDGRISFISPESFQEGILTIDFKHVILRDKDGEVLEFALLKDFSSNAEITMDQKKLGVDERSRNLIAQLKRNEIASHAIFDNDLRIDVLIKVTEAKDHNGNRSQKDTSTFLFHNNAQLVTNMIYSDFKRVPRDINSFHNNAQLIVRMTCNDFNKLPKDISSFELIGEIASNDTIQIDDSLPSRLRVVDQGSFEIINDNFSYIPDKSITWHYLDWKSDPMRTSEISFSSDIDEEKKYLKFNMISSQASQIESTMYLRYEKSKLQFYKHDMDNITNSFFYEPAPVEHHDSKSDATNTCNCHENDRESAYSSIFTVGTEESHDSKYIKDPSKSFFKKLYIFSGENAESSRCESDTTPKISNVTYSLDPETGSDSQCNYISRELEMWANTEVINKESFVAKPLTWDELLLDAFGKIALPRLCRSKGVDLVTLCSMIARSSKNDSSKSPPH